MNKRAQSHGTRESAPIARQGYPGQLSTQQQSGLNGKISASAQATDSKLASDQLRAGKPGQSEINTGIEAFTSPPACSNAEAGGNQT